MSESHSLATLNLSIAISVILDRTNLPLKVFGNESMKYTPPRSFARFGNLSVFGKGKKRSIKSVYFCVNEIEFYQ